MEDGDLENRRGGEEVVKVVELESVISVRWFLIHCAKRSINSGFPIMVPSFAPIFPSFDSCSTVYRPQFRRCVLLHGGLGAGGEGNAVSVF